MRCSLDRGVTAAIFKLTETGNEQADLIPVQSGGSYQG
jgi:hypothetical protein